MNMTHQKIEAVIKSFFGGRDSFVEVVRLADYSDIVHVYDKVSRKLLYSINIPLNLCLYTIVKQIKEQDYLRRKENIV